MNCPVCGSPVDGAMDLMIHAFSKHRDEIVEAMSEVSYKEDKNGP